MIESSLIPILVLVGEPDHMILVREYIESFLPGFTFLMAPNAFETIRTMHQLDRSAIFVISHDLPPVQLADIEGGITMDGLQLAKHVRRSFRFGSFCIVLTDDPKSILYDVDDSNIICRPKNIWDSSLKRVYYRNEFFLSDILGGLIRLREKKLDAQTKIFTIEEAKDRWKRDFERAKAARTFTSFLIGDMDDLSRINTEFGHPVGDMVIDKVGGVFRLNTRYPYDYAARLSKGDEFALFMPETKMRGAEKVRNRIVEHMRSLHIEVGDKTIPISMSFGLAELAPRDLREFGNSADGAFDKMYREADAVLYASKLALYKRLADKHRERGEQEEAEHMLQKYNKLKKSREKQQVPDKTPAP